MKIRELMSSIAHTCRAQDSLDTAANRLWEHDCGFLPVVDSEGRVRATITDRDICMAAYTKGARLAELRVADAMSAGLVCCHRDEELESVTQRMCEHQFHRLPVVDEHGRACGVLSLNDLAVEARRDPRIGQAALNVLIAVSHHRAEVPVGLQSGSRAAKPKVKASKMTHLDREA